MQMWGLMHRGLGRHNREEDRAARGRHWHCALYCFSLHLQLPLSASVPPTSNGLHSIKDLVCIHSVQVWDTNQQMVACKFEFSDRIFGVGMSPLASSHCLVAVASDDPTVKLCDPTTGGCMHSLVGHRHPVLSVTWALGSEHQLVSAGGDGEVSLGF